LKLSDLPAATLEKASHLVAKIGDAELPDPTGWHVLILQYVREERSKGGIIFADKTLKEDVYQGRCGVVLAVGPAAYSDKAKFGLEPWCKPGDWVMWPPVEAAAARTAYGEGITLAFIADDRVLATGVDPVIATGG
jgi:co-chaperonin GroES (HSP10)